MVMQLACNGHATVMIRSFNGYWRESRVFEGYFKGILRVFEEYLTVSNAYFIILLVQASGLGFVTGFTAVFKVRVQVKVKGYCLFLRSAAPGPFYFICKTLFRRRVADDRICKGGYLWLLNGYWTVIKLSLNGETLQIIEISQFATVI